MDYEEKVRLSDSELRKCFSKLGVYNISEIQHMERDKRNEIIRKIKSLEGVTIRNLARLTGISKSVIDRI